MKFFHAGTARVRLAVLLGCAGLAAMTARGQVTAAERARAHCIAKEDAAILKECVDTTPEQADAIDRLTEGAVQSLLAVQYEAERIERRRMLKRERSGIKESREAQVKEFETIERQWLDDLRLTLTGEQADGWLRFEKARRRVVLYGVPITGRIDLPAAVVLLGADEDENPALKAAIVSWENETDTHAKEWITLMTEPALYNSPEGQKKLEKSSQLVHAMAVANVRGCRAVAEALTESQRGRLAALRLRAYAGGITPALSQAAVTQEVMAIPSLPEAKKEQVRRIVAEHQQQVREIGVWFLKTADEALLAATGEDSLHQLVDQAISKVDLVELSLEEALMALLTEAERAEFKRIPPVPYEWRGMEDTGWRWGGPLENEGK